MGPSQAGLVWLGGAPQPRKGTEPQKLGGLCAPVSPSSPGVQSAPPESGAAGECGRGTAAPQGVRVSEWLLPGCSAQRAHTAAPVRGHWGKLWRLHRSLLGGREACARGVVFSEAVVPPPRAGKGARGAGGAPGSGDPGSASQGASPGHRLPAQRRSAPRGLRLVLQKLWGEVGLP